MPNGAIKANACRADRGRTVASKGGDQRRFSHIRHGQLPVIELQVTTRAT
jgi:hypothetical protein